VVRFCMVLLRERVVDTGRCRCGPVSVRHPSEHIPRVISQRLLGQEGPDRASSEP